MDTNKHESETNREDTNCANERKFSNDGWRLIKQAGEFLQKQTKEGEQDEATTNGHE